MTEERKHAILFSATILAARKLAGIGHKPCPAREGVHRRRDPPTPREMLDLLVKKYRICA